MSDLRKSMLSFHAQGFGRFSKVIDENQNYDSLIANKISDDFHRRFGKEIPVEEKISSAIAVNKSLLLDAGKPIRSVRFDHGGAVCFGSTRNNLREFEWFERLCSNRSLTILSHNLHAYPSKRRKKDEEVLAAARILLEDVESFYASREKISPGLVHQQVLYTQTFLSWLFSVTDKGAVLPGLMVLANDHAPAHVAISLLMKGAKVPRVYIQHAEVTPAFPPLDFEYSILRNARSLEIYRSIGPTPEGTYVISREEAPFALEKLKMGRGDTTDVLVYPTSRVMPEKLKEVIAALNSNPGIRRVSIKPHPNSAPIVAQALSGTDVAVVDTVPDDMHIAIVGNSSVVVELLHKGIPVYQNYDFDPIDADYYGFSRDGLTPIVSIQQMGGRFWQDYHVDQSWIERYSELNPAASSKYEQDKEKFLAEMNQVAARVANRAAPPTALPMPKSFLKRIVFKTFVSVINRKPDFFRRIINAAVKYTDLGRGHAFVKRASIRLTPEGDNNNGSKNRVSTVDLAVLSLSESRDPAAWLGLALEVAIFDDIDLILAINQLLVERDPSAKDILAVSENLPVNSALRLWVVLKDANWSAKTIPRDRLLQISSSVYECDADYLVRKQLEKELLLCLLRIGEAGDVRSYANHAKFVSFDDFAINFKIDILRKLSSDPETEEYAAGLRNKFERSSSGFHRLKYKNMDILTGRAPKEWDHQYMERQFVALAPKPIAEMFNDQVEPLYARLRPRMAYMDIRIKKEECDDLQSTIRMALCEKRPFSLVRLGDGEGYLFSKNRRYFQSFDISNRERHWWGVELHGQVRDGIIDLAHKTLAAADVVGIPSVHRFIRDHNDNSQSLTQTTQGRGLLEVLSGVEAATRHDARFAEDRVNVCLFSDIDYILELCQIADDIVLVGSVQPEKLPSKILECGNFSSLVVPTHYRNSGNDYYHNGDKPFPYTYGELLTELEQRVRPGTLVLVAAGIVGKIFVGRARELGAVALDIGGVVGDWGGGTTKLR